VGLLDLFFGTCLVLLLVFARELGALSKALLIKVFRVLRLSRFIRLLAELLVGLHRRMRAGEMALGVESL
jgi:hypothetical protein